MGFRFRKTFGLGKGLRLNLSKSGMSLSAGGPGASINVGSRGSSSNVGIPGTGLSYRSQLTSGRSARNSASAAAGNGATLASAVGCLGALLATVGLILLIAESFTSGSSLAILGVSLLVVTSMMASANKERQRRTELERHANLVLRFGDEIATRIVAGEVWLGQNEEQLRESLGDPLDIDEKVMKTKTRQVWKYDQAGANRFNTRVTLENGLVTGWDKK